MRCQPIVALLTLEFVAIAPTLRELVWQGASTFPSIGNRVATLLHFSCGAVGQESFGPHRVAGEGWYLSSMPAALSATIETMPKVLRPSTRSSPMRLETQSQLFPDVSKTTMRCP